MGSGGQKSTGQGRRGFPQSVARPLSFLTLSFVAHVLNFDEHHFTNFCFYGLVLFVSCLRNLRFLMMQIFSSRVFIVNPFMVGSVLRSE